MAAAAAEAAAAEAAAAEDTSQRRLEMLSQALGIEQKWKLDPEERIRKISVCLRSIGDDGVAMSLA